MQFDDWMRGTPELAMVEKQLATGTTSTPQILDGPLGGLLHYYGRIPGLAMSGSGMPWQD